MKKFYFTLGQSHVHKLPDGTVWDKDGILEVVAKDEEQAVDRVNEFANWKWSNVYDGATNQSEDFRVHFSKGIVSTIYVGYGADPQDLIECVADMAFEIGGYCQRFPDRETEIDWDRPQIVRGHSTGVIVKTIPTDPTDGISWRAFKGEVIHKVDSEEEVGNISSSWVKDNFSYVSEADGTVVTNELQTSDSMSLRYTAIVWAKEFIKLHEGRIWDGEYIDCILEFFNNKTK